MIEFDDVSKTFAGEPAVSNLDLTFAEGAFTVLVGTSGSGNHPEDDQPTGGA